MLLPWRVVIGVVSLWLVPAPPAGAQDCRAADALLSGPAAASQNEAAYLEALARCPQHPAALNNLADIYEQAGRFDDALAYYHRAAQAYRDTNAGASLQALPHFGVGDVYRKMHRPDEALYWYRKGLELDPDDRESLDAVADLTQGDPANLVDARSIARVLDGARSGGVLATVALDQRVLAFAYDRADLLPESRAQLREIAYGVRDVLGAPRSMGVLSVGPPVAQIGGHADRRGGDDYNRDLARRRAQAVVDALVEQFQIPRSRLTVAAYGESRPLCNDDTEACHARNRRVEIRQP